MTRTSQHFTGETFFQHDLPHERSGLSHWRRRIGDKLEVLLAESLRVGLTEAEANAPGLNFECKFSDMRDWLTVRRLGEAHAAAKILIESDSERILGAHILGPKASEIIDQFGFAIRTGLKVDVLMRLVSANLRRFRIAGQLGGSRRFWRTS